MEYLKLLNGQLTIESIYVSGLILLAIYYYRKNCAAYAAAYLFAVQSLFELVLLTFTYTSLYVGFASYALKMALSWFVIYRLYLLVKTYKIKMGLIEFLVMFLQCFLMMCHFMRFVDRQYLNNVELSSIYTTTVVTTYHCTIFVLMLPVLIGLLNKITKSIPNLVLVSVPSLQLEGKRWT